MASLERRDFFKLALAASIELSPLRPLGRVVEHLDNNGLVGEGSPPQRIASAEKIINLIELDPTDPEKRELFGAWLRFNAAEQWSRHKGYNFTAHALRHNLYGKGEALEVSNLYSSAVIKHYERLKTGQDSDQILAHYFGLQLTDRFIGDAETHDLAVSNERRYSFNVSTEKLKELLVREQNFPFSLTTVVKPVSFEYADGVQTYDRSYFITDHRYSLNRHTILVKGEITQVEPKDTDESDPFYRITLNSPQVAIYDRYHWSYSQGADIHINGIATDLGVLATDFLKSTLGMSDKKLSREPIRSVLKVLKDTDIATGRKDGILLTKYGFARDFEEFASFSLRSPVVFDLSDEIFQR